MIGGKNIWESPPLVQSLTGLPWMLFLELFFKNRKRAIGGGRKFSTPLVVRVVMLLMYMRLYVTQEVVASIFGKWKWDVSRDLRNLLPLITAQRSAKRESLNGGRAG